jgi:hypothetical protein
MHNTFNGRNKVAVITSLDPDYKSPFVYDWSLATNFIKFTTQDAHNFNPGDLVTVSGLYVAATRAGTTYAARINGATIVRCDSSKTFVADISEVFANPLENDIDGNPVTYMRFSSISYPLYNDLQNFYVNSSGYASDKLAFTHPLTSDTYDLFKVNPFVVATSIDGPLNSYKVSYGDTL